MATAAHQWEDITSAIVDFCYKNNKDVFHKLRRIQTKECKIPVTVDFGDNTRDTKANSWGRYFKQLGTPQQDDTFDSDYEKYLQINYLLQSLTVRGHLLLPVGSATIGKVINTLTPQNTP